MTARAPFLLATENDRNSVVGLITSLSLKKPWAITIEPHRKKRSLSQNGLYWKWLDETVALVSKETGNDSDDLHEFFKQKFTMPKTFGVNGEACRRWTTTTLTTGEMSEFIDRVYAWVTSELGIMLQMPQHEGPPNVTPP